VIVSGPSGAGKTSICGPVLERLDGIALSVSVTTRPPRPGETDGEDYRFVDETGFDRMLAADEFAEWAEVHGYRYGTSKRAIDEALADGHDLLLDIDVQGAQQIKEAYPHAAMVFVLPPSRQQLEKRLRERGTDDEGAVKRRLDNACREVAAMTHYDYAIVNEVLSRTVDALTAIVQAERNRVTTLSRDALRRILAEFETAP